MNPIAIDIENISKQYRLGLVGTRTLGSDISRWWAKLRGKEDPTLKIGQSNLLDVSGGSHIWALKGIDLQVEEGQVLGIIGKNGAGKSTLLKILSRVTAPTTGNIKIRGRIASMLEVGTGFHQELTGRENIFLNGAILGMSKEEIKAKFDEIVAFSGVEKYIDTPVKRYSSGMHVRLAFAVAAHLDPEILIIDEVLAVGDAEFQKKALGKMQDVSKGGRTILFVSHNLGMIDNLCTHAIHMQNGSIIKKGYPTEIITHYLDSLRNTLKNPSEHLEIGNYHRISHLKTSPREIRSGDKLDISFSIQSSIDDKLNGFALLIYNAYDTRVAIIDLRKSDRVHTLEASISQEYKIKIPCINLVEGTYKIGFYLSTNYVNENFNDLLSFEIMPKQSAPDLIPYPGKARGIVDLPFLLEIS
jgi:lipopolysaccharide transport system ATP-binding protein